MIRSMTGYGKGQATAAGISLTVEIRSVNHRYSDMSTKLPRVLTALEGEIKKKAGERLRRGKIDIFVNLELEGTGGLTPRLNRSLAEAYIDLFKQMQEMLATDSEIPLALLATQRDVILLREEEPAEGNILPVVETALEKALQAIEQMRMAEGESIRQDLESRLGTIIKFLSEVESRAAQVPQEWQGKLTDRLARLAPEVAFDPQRVAQEIAIFADRCDITEEIVRFHSHLQQFRLLLTAAEPVGRQMDFLVQELNREANTMGSKSNDAELTRVVVSLKAELEKVREQVQNVE